MRSLSLILRHRNTGLWNAHLTIFQKKKGMFVVEKLNKEEKKFINDSIKELMDDNKEDW